ncbi:antitoxin Xre/MbcA/ParS toxin-binding domain-containing protein [Ottowia sp.]|jgi:hypothetical protein|uniref:antitoxin Xre/MbcA/ParS toxin-binding domain-containing protein n=1 Tax=Ottowia sp. TaxID=1898956 RepID=UPI002600EE1F|nr:antitoxin Xre/MbcA/ParS toxin-binding domain-containing protein [Ottowia sp.]MBK6615004.1 DUF2384 domain-containing protein [Ottowia sp.]
MNEVELGQALKRLLDERGISEWELSRQANVKIELVAAALKGSGSVPLAAWCRLAFALRAEVTLSPALSQARVVGPVETVVDRALLALQERAGVEDTPRQQPSGDGVGAFVSGHRALLDRLEEFARTPAFARLQATVSTCGAGESAAWLAGWLIQPAVGLGGLPIDIVLEPGGLDRVNEQLQRIMLNPGGLRD